MQACGGMLTHLCSYKVHLEKFFADMGNGGLPPVWIRIKICHGSRTAQVQEYFFERFPFLLLSFKSCAYRSDLRRVRPLFSDTTLSE